MSKNCKPIILSKNFITWLDDVFVKSQTKHQIFKALEKYHQTFFNENMKAAPDKSCFWSNSFDLTKSSPVKFLGPIIKETTLATLKSQIDAVFQPQLLSKKKKNLEFLGMLTFFSKNPHKSHLYLRPNYTILRQQNNFECTLEQ